MQYPRFNKRNSYVETALFGSMATIYANPSPKEPSLSNATTVTITDISPVSAATHAGAGSALQQSMTTKNAQKPRIRAGTAVQHAEDHTLRGLRSAQSAKSRSRLPRLLMSQDRRDSHCPRKNPLSQQPKTGRQYSRESVKQLAAVLEALAEPAAEPTKR